MDALWSNMTPPDWIALGFVAMVPVLMVVAIHLIRAELHRAHPRGRVRSSGGAAQPPLHLKTTKAQREQWRMGKQRHPRAIVDLTDDIETLLKRIGAGH